MALLKHWIARFGVPEDITSNRGPQFTSSVWAEFQKLFGIKVHQTTSYHPQANRMVERLHRQLKASLKARTTTTDWFVELPLVLLGIRSSWRVGRGCSAELVYGTTIRLPGEFLQASESFTMEPDTAFVKQLQRTMRAIQPSAPQYHDNGRSYVPSNLSSTGYVYVRHDGYRHPLQRRYDGPFKIISTNDKHFTVDIKGRAEKITVDRLKAAPVTPTTAVTTTPTLTTPPAVTTTPAVRAAPTVKTRSGRVSRPTIRF